MDFRYETNRGWHLSPLPMYLFFRKWEIIFKYVNFYWFGKPFYLSPLFSFANPSWQINNFDHFWYKQGSWEPNIAFQSQYDIHCVKVSAFVFALVHILPHSDWIWRDTMYLSAFNPNEGKYWPEWLPIRAFFTQWFIEGISLIQMFKKIGTFFSARCLTK